MLPFGVGAVVLADLDFHRASFIHWLQNHDPDYVVRIKKGSIITHRHRRLRSAIEAVGGSQRAGLVSLAIDGLLRSFQAVVSQRDRAGVASLELAFLGKLRDLPPSCLPESANAG